MSEGDTEPEELRRRAELRRRVKAARALAGISVPELAERLGQRGLGERTLRELEGDKGRPFRAMELREIARACDLPYEFFTVDFNDLPRIAHDQVTAAEVEQRLESKIDELQASMEQRFAEVLGEGRGREELDALLASTRAMTEFFAGPGGDDDEEAPAAQRKSDEPDASEESPSAQTPEKRRGAGRRGR